MRKELTESPLRELAQVRLRQLFLGRGVSSVQGDTLIDRV